LKSRKPGNSEVYLIKEKLYKTITIYGPYYPKDKKRRLRDLRDYLRKFGYKSTYVVSDYPADFFPDKISQETKSLERSEYCLDHSDLNIFIYLFDCPLTGVQVELDYVIEKNKENYLLFVEEKLDENNKKVIAFSDLVRGKLKRIGKRFIKFDEGDDDVLHDVVYQRIADFFI
jgi:hypothetical protein